MHPLTHIRNFSLILQESEEDMAAAWSQVMSSPALTTTQAVVMSLKAEKQVHLPLPIITSVFPLTFITYVYILLFHSLLI